MNRFGEEKDVDIRADDPTRPDWEKDAKAAADLAESAGVKAGQAASKAVGEASRKVRRATDRASEVYDRTSERAAQAYRGLREYAIEHPGTAVAVTFGAGLVFGSHEYPWGVANVVVGSLPMTSIASISPLRGHTALSILGGPPRSQKHDQSPYCALTLARASARK